jgi:toxin ParE1/3/4
MNSYMVTRKAHADLIKIGRFTEKEWGIAQRNKYLKLLDESFQQLSENSDIGITCNYIAEGYRKFPQGSHLIFYKLNPEGGILIIRVLHKSMDVELKF